jgi:hypothetical protein
LFLLSSQSELWLVVCPSKNDSSVRSYVVIVFFQAQNWKRFLFSHLFFCSHPSATAPTRLQRRGTLSFEPRSRLAREANETDKEEAEEEEEEGEEEKDTARSVI